MQIDYICDLHLDMWIRGILDENDLAYIFGDGGLDYLRNNSGDVLLIAGDLGHSNIQNQHFLTLMQSFYPHILFVLGNHDYYLTPTQENAHFKTSLQRVNAMRTWAKEQKGIYCLDGNVLEIDGVRFGGCDSWYDGSYGHRYFLINDARLQSLWKACMNDAHYMPGIPKWNTLWLEEKLKLDSIYKECDVMLTHVPPSSNKEHVAKKYQDSDITSFFTFDGERYVKEGTISHWVYGHTHDKNFYINHGVKHYCNPLGYPGERKEQVEIESFIINPKNTKINKEQN